MTSPYAPCIAVVVPGGVDRSGEYRVVPVLLTLIRHLSRYHPVHVIALNQEPDPAQWELAGARIHNIGKPNTHLRAIATLRRLHRQRPFALVQAIWSGWAGLVAVLAARSLGIPSCIHLAGGELIALPDIHYGGRLTWRSRLRENLTLKAATRLSAASLPMIDALRALNLQGELIPLGVDLTHWPPCEPRRRVPGAPARLLHAASINHVKDQPTLLRAIAALQGNRAFHLDIVGEDTLDGAIQQLAERLGLTSRVTFHGFKTQRELRPMIEQTDLLLMSSRHEAGPLVMLEAAVAGVPTVGTAVGHIAEWSPEAAWAVPIGDATTLAAAIQKLLDDEALRLRIAGEAHRRALREDADYTARCFQKLHNSLKSLRRAD